MLAPLLPTKTLALHHNAGQMFSMETELPPVLRRWAQEETETPERDWDAVWEGADARWQQQLAAEEWAEAVNEYARRPSFGDQPRAATQVAVARQRAPGDLTTRAWELILGAFGWACAYCGDRERLLCLDHVVPVARGGATAANNVVPACAACNALKGAKPPESWLGESEALLDGFLVRVAKANAAGWCVEKEPN